MQFQMKEFKRKTGHDMANNLRVARRLRTAAERAKRTLSCSTETTIEVDSLFDGIDFHTKVSFRNLNFCINNSKNEKEKEKENSR